MKPITVLLAEDHTIVREGFRKMLELEDDLEVVGEAQDGRQAVAMVGKLRPAVVLMDIAMPRLNGLEATRQVLKVLPATKVLILSAHSDDAYVKSAAESGAAGFLLKQTSAHDVCRAIRARSHVPIIMVTAKGTEIDTVVGLEVGADDYVTKPYRLRELVARMRAVLRRSPLAAPGAQPAGETADRGAVSEVGGVRVDPDRHRVFVRGQEVHLRRKEFELLVLLVENAGRVLTRDTLIDRVWGADYVGDTKTLDVHIKRLRTHVEADPSAPAIITTVRGVGYRFEIPADG